MQSPGTGRHGVVGSSGMTLTALPPASLHMSLLPMVGGHRGHRRNVSDPLSWESHARLHARQQQQLPSELSPSEHPASSIAHIRAEEARTRQLQTGLREVSRSLVRAQSSAQLHLSLLQSLGDDDPFRNELKREAASSQPVRLTPSPSTVATLVPPPHASGVHDRATTNDSAHLPRVLPPSTPLLPQVARGRGHRRSASDPLNDALLWARRATMVTSEAVTDSGVGAMRRVTEERPSSLTESFSSADDVTHDLR